MFMVLDIETDGVGSFRPPVQRPVEIAWVVCDPGGAVRKQQSVLVSGVEYIHPKAEEVHGYSVEHVNKYGIPIEAALGMLEADSKDVELIVGHNIDFDMGCLRRQLELLGCLSRARAGMFTIHTKPTFCTMRKGTGLCKLPFVNGGSGYKWPKLSELAKMAGVEVVAERLHGALYDVEVTRDCYTRLFLPSVAT